MHNHYSIVIDLCEEDAKIIKQEIMKLAELNSGFAIMIDANMDIKPEFDEAMKNIIGSVIKACMNIKEEKVN